jgi:hypothetical protein
MFKRLGIETKSDAKRHASSHSGIGGKAHEVVIAEKEALSNAVRKGDRIKLKEDAILPYREACKAAGWDVNLEAVRTVQRIDTFGTGGRERLFVEGPPFAFYKSDVQLAWNSDQERREALGL